MDDFIRMITKARYDALTFSRHPLSQIIGREVEWYSDTDENVLGCIILDRTDQDWTYVVLGRDERGLFRCINVNSSFQHIGDARSQMRDRIMQHAKDGTKVFPQGDAKRRKNEIFKPRCTEDRLHPFFKVLSTEEGYSPAREIIKEIAYAFIDLDGNFIEQFQTSGFNSRLWELYLYAFLHEELFILDHSHSSPDFTCIGSEQPVFIEAVTVNPSPDFDIKEPPHSPAEYGVLIRDYMPIKYGSALYSKLKKEYWKLDHVRGHRLILALHDFHMKGSMIWSSAAIEPYLYGIETRCIYDDKGNLIPIPVTIDQHTFGKKAIPSGFFFQENVEHISAVLFSNSATVSKFNRMGKLAGFGSPRVKMIRAGTCYDHDPNATKPRDFSVEVDPSTYSESWGQGLSMFHNPNALHPTDPEWFPWIAHHFLKDGRITSYIPDFFPYSSITHILVPKNVRKKI